jgi:hypothetical protein
MEIMMHTQSLLIEVVTDAFPTLRLRRMVSGLLNAVMVAPSPLWRWVGACPPGHSLATSSSEHGEE